MYKDNLIWIANTESGEHINILPAMANRHGLIAGATGTGKTVTLKVMAEAFSQMGVPVFMADVKGDIAGMMAPGTDSEDMQERIKRFGIDDFSYQGFPVTFWDIYGQKGIQLRTTVSEIGPLLLSRILGLNELQSDLLTIIFKIADDNNLLLIDTKDLKAMVNYVRENADEYTANYGKISPASLDVIVRNIVALESAGGDIFFGEPDLQITDWFTAGSDGKGMIHILDSSSLVNNGKLYSTFLLWLLSELFESLPEVGDLDKPKMVFFFDEAHLLFADATKELLDKIEQVVKLIRSKGVGIYFCTQNPADIPSGVLGQLGNKVQHALRAFTPAEQKGIKAAAESFRENPAFDTKTVLQELGTGQALISVLAEDGTPTVVEKGDVLPPMCSFGAISDAERDQAIKGSMLYSKYAQGVDNESAYETLGRETEKREAEKAEAEAAKIQEKEDAEAAKLAEKQAKEEQKAIEKAEKDKKRAVKSVGNTVAGTIGRELGKQAGKSFGSFGKTLGGNTGASLARGIMNTLLK